MLKCPICNSEYEEGSERFCGTCMYSIGTDFYLTNLLNTPSNEELRQYNQSLDQYRTLWKSKLPLIPLERTGFVDMVEVKGGNIQQGNSEEESGEATKHLHEINDYLIGTTPITLGLFIEFIEETDYQTDADREGWSYINIGGRMERKSGVNYKYDTQGNIRNENENDHPVIHVS